MTTEAIALFRKFGLHASALALMTCRTCVHLDSDPRDDPCARCIRFDRWEGKRTDGVTGTPEAQPADSLETELAACRDVFPIPEPGSHLEQLWANAMGDPYSVAAYVKAAAGVEGRKP